MQFNKISNALILLMLTMSLTACGKKNIKEQSVTDNNQQSVTDNSKKSVTDNSKKSVTDNSKKSVTDNSKKTTDTDNNKKPVIDNNHAINTNIIPNIPQNNDNILLEKQLQQLQQENIIYFDLNKYNISNNYSQVLDQHAIFLCKNPSYKIIIEGHTDERGTPKYNIALGERRANAVKSYLQSKGVLSEQISILSYGKEKPAVIGHDESAYSKNRRVVLIYKN